MLRVLILLLLLLLILPVTPQAGTKNQASIYFKDGTVELGELVWMQNDKVYLNKNGELWEFEKNEVLLDKTIKANKLDENIAVAPKKSNIPRKNNTASKNSVTTTYVPPRDSQAYNEYIRDLQRKQTPAVPNYSDGSSSADENSELNYKSEYDINRHYRKRIKECAKFASEDSEIIETRKEYKHVKMQLRKLEENYRNTTATSANSNNYYSRQANNLEFEIFKNKKDHLEWKSSQLKAIIDNYDKKINDVVVRCQQDFEQLRVKRILDFRKGG